MKKVAQEKKKWKDKASHGGGGGSSGPASGIPDLSMRMGTTLQSVQGSGRGQEVAISQGVQRGGVQKAPVTVNRAFQQAVISNVALPSCSTASSASNISSGIDGASRSSSSGGHSSNHQSSTAGRPTPTFCGGSLAATKLVRVPNSQEFGKTNQSQTGNLSTTKPASAFYKPQAAQPSLPRGNFRPQEQSSTFKHQAPSKVCYPNHANMGIF